METEKENLSAGEKGFSPDEHRLNITLATNAVGWNTTVNGQLIIELAKDPRVKVSGLVPSSPQEQKEQAKELNIELVDAKKLIGYSPKELLAFPPDSLDIDVLIIHSYGRDLSVDRRRLFKSPRNVSGFMFYIQSVKNWRNIWTRKLLAHVQLSQTPSIKFN
ncbi:hypothetical protein ACROYT_G004037 [Oculina patagonica]